MAAKKKAARSTAKKKATSKKKVAAKKVTKKVAKKVAKKAPARKKAPAKKAARKTAAKKKTATKKTARKTSTKKTTAKKKVTKKTTKKVAKKAPAKKAVSKKKAPSKKKVAKKKAAPAKKAATKKTAKKKPVANKKPVAKKAPAKKAPAKKATPQRKKKVARAERRSRADVISGPIHGVQPYQPKRGEEYMSDDQLEHFRSILMAWKRELMEEVDRTVHHMQDEAANFPDPNDRATQESEFGLELRTRDRERKLLRKISSALTRIDDGTYGYCDETGEEIGLKRLEARPVATLCLEAQERRELAERQFRDRDDRYR
ncbi:MAG: RNA polymerase-binding protein DksA [Pseudomonadota bacterium]